jgi:hypothetical protein
MSYRGIQARAIDAGLQVDANGVKKQIEIAMVESGAYPTSLATLNQGRGVTASNGATYQYSVNNGVSPATFCLTITSSKSSNSYYVGNNSTIQTGLCAGHTAYVAGPSYTFANLIWTPLASSGTRSWTSVAASDDGTKVVATESGGYIYRSTDSGATWTALTGSGIRTWGDVTSSADGTKLAAVVEEVDAGYIYTSTDSGATWTERTGGGAHYWHTIASSADGMKLAAGWEIGYINTSTDGGVTWTQRNAGGTTKRWQSIASSDDGTKLIGLASSDYIYTSTDSGATWTQRSSPGGGNWYGSAITGDGLTMLATGISKSVWRSSDGGSTWTDLSSIGATSFIATGMSDDGSKLYVGSASYNQTYVSKDGGINWIMYTNGGSYSNRSLTTTPAGATVYLAPYGTLHKGQFD